MAKSKDEIDECEVIDILLRNNGFNDDEDARYAVIDDLVSVSDSNQQYDDEMCATYFYNGVIPFDKLEIIKLY